MGRVLALIVALLVAPATAWGGGWAITTLSSTPTGKHWDVDITVLQHGVTPMENIKPAVVIELPDGGERRFLGRPTGEPGVYRASVVFPKAGRYGYHVDDGFTNAFPNDYGKAQIGAVEDNAGGLKWWIAAAVVSLLIVLAAVRRAASSSAGRRSARAAAPGPSG
jgi:hypothetical protein